MTSQCDHIIEARRPVIVVVEKESNKAIIVDIASPWDHRVYEKESEKVEKYQDLKRETRKSMGYYTCGSGTGSGWCTRCSKQKIGYMAGQAGDYH